MHETAIHVRWGELDPYDHVNHTAYLGYLEHARVMALDAIGWSMSRLRDAGYQVVVVSVDVRFRRPATGGDELIVRTGVEEIRAASSIWHQQITRDDEVLVEATVHAASTDLDGRPVRTPEEFRLALTAFRQA
ncbi:acyl-CoA thioesterase [bacterium]|nr:acyl-CoA thioesterase [bacterium]